MTNATLTHSSTTPQAAPLDPAGPPPRYPLSAQQARFYDAYRANPANLGLIASFRVALKGRVDPALTEEALRRLLRRHEVLRTRIVELDGAPMQEVVADPDFTLETRDLSALGAEARLSEADVVCARMAREPFDIGQAPLMRALFVRLEKDEALLQLLYSSFIVDGWSHGIVVREFGAILDALMRGVEPDLPPVALQFGDYARWQRELLESEELDEERAFWRRRLAGAPRVELPTDKPRPALAGGASDIRTLLLPKDLNDALVQYSRTTRQTLFQIAATTLSAMLSRQTGASDLVIGAPSSNRDEVELETMVGPELNMLAMRLDVSGDPSFETLTERSFETIAEAMANQRLPFSTVVDIVGAAPDPSRTPLYSVGLVQQSVHIDTGRTSDMVFVAFEIVSAPSLPSGATTDLLFFLVGREEGWRISCEYDATLFESATVDRLLRRWVQTIEAMISSGGAIKIAAVSYPDIDRFTPGPVPGLAAAKSAAAAPQAQAAPATMVSTPVAAPVPAAAPGSGSTAAPQSVIDALVTIWREVLDKPSIHAGSDFFDNGGHSLSAMRMITRVNKSYDLKLKVAQLFKAPQLAQFAEIVAAARPDLAAAPSAAPVSPAPAPVQPAPVQSAAAPIAPSPAAPTDLTPIVSELVTIWREVLDKPGVHAGSDFFDNGGHSLSAMRMIARVNKRYDLKLKVGQLFKAPMLEQFARVIADARPELLRAPAAPAAAQPVAAAPAQTSGVRPVIALNNGAAFVVVERRLSGGRPILDVPVGGPEDAEFAVNHTLEESVERVVDRIQEMQPKGPYLLLAYCALSPIITEAARQLRDRGEEVDLVAVMDSMAPDYFQRLSWMGRNIRRATRLKRAAGYWWELFTDYRKGKISLTYWLNIYGFIRRTNLIPFLVKHKILKPLPEEEGEQQQSLQFFDAMLAAGYRRRAAPIDTRRFVSFCSNDVYRGRHFPPVQGWGDVVQGEIEEYRVPCEHRQMMREPFASLIGLHLDKVILEIEAQRASDSVAQ